MLIFSICGEFSILFFLIKEIKSKEYEIILSARFVQVFWESTKAILLFSSFAFNFLYSSINFPLSSLALTLTFSKDNDFQFKTFSTECKNFTISGNISYNEKKAAIYVTNIKYCGANDPVEYKKIECSLYEKNGDLVRKISSYESQQENIKLQEFLENITLSVDNYDRTCKEYQSDSFYLLIKATNDNDKITTYEIPLKLDECN